MVYSSDNFLFQGWVKWLIHMVMNIIMVNCLYTLWWKYSIVLLSGCSQQYNSWMTTHNIIITRTMSTVGWRVHFAIQTMVNIITVIYCRLVFVQNLPYWLLLRLRKAQGYIHHDSISNYSSDFQQNQLFYFMCDSTMNAFLW